MRVVFQKAALDDLGSIADYIRPHSPAGARTVIQRIRTATENLSHFSHFGRIGLEPGTRELVVRRTSYIIVYRVVEGEPPFVEVIGIFHGHMDRGEGPAAEEIRRRVRPI